MWTTQLLTCLNIEDERICGYFCPLEGLERSAFQFGFTEASAKAALQRSQPVVEVDWWICSTT